jgi:hypothetical protein
VTDSHTNALCPHSANSAVGITKWSDFQQDHSVTFLPCVTCTPTQVNFHFFLCHTSNTRFHWLLHDRCLFTLHPVCNTTSLQAMTFRTSISSLITIDRFHPANTCFLPSCPMREVVHTTEMRRSDFSCFWKITELV